MDFQVIKRTDDEREQDQEVLRSLATAGSDLSRPHPIDFYFYFPRREWATAAARVLAQEGFLVAIRGPRIPWWKRPFVRAPHKVEAHKSVVPTEDTIFALTDRLNALAKEHGGTYEGWEAPVLR